MQARRVVGPSRSRFRKWTGRTKSRNRWALLIDQLHILQQQLVAFPDRLPNEILVKIFEYAVADNYDRSVRLADVIRMMPICQRGWDLRSLLFNRVNLTTAGLKRGLSQILAILAYEPFFTAATKHLRIEGMHSKDGQKRLLILVGATVRRLTLCRKFSPRIRTRCTR